MDLRPHMMRPVPVNPESRTPRGRLGTFAKLMMFFADYWLGYWMQIRPKLVRSTLVVSNRYFDDILVDPRRYRFGTLTLERGKAGTPPLAIHHTYYGQKVRKNR